MLSRIKYTSAYANTKEIKKAVLRKLALPKYRGDKYVCPVCDTHLRTFKPIWKSFMRQIDGSHPYPYKSLQTFNWQSYSCPACDASDRERLIVLYLKRIGASFDPQRHYRVVEFAPSPALQRQLKHNPAFEYRSADLNRKNVDDQIDIRDMHPYRDESVDVFICSHVLEHVTEDRKAIGELYRVLAEDGFGVVIVPLINGMDETDEDKSTGSRESRFLRYGDGDHVRQYGIRDFQGRLKTAGFRVELLGKEFFGVETFLKAGIALDSVLYIVKKSVRPEVTASAQRDARASISQ